MNKGLLISAKEARSLVEASFPDTLLESFLVKVGKDINIAATAGQYSIQLYIDRYHDVKRHPRWAERIIVICREAGYTVHITPNYDEFTDATDGHTVTISWEE